MIGCMLKKVINAIINREGENLIQVCTKKDIEALKDLSIQTFDETFRAQNKTKNIEQYLANAFTTNKLLHEIENPHSYFYIIYYQQKLAGYLKVNILDAQTEQYPGNNLEIERIYILKDFQKFGLGKQLFNRAVTVAETKGCDQIWLGVWEKNNNAIQFYERLGFSKIDEHAFYMGDERQVDFIMSRPLKEDSYSNVHSETVS